jgi:hypothetical protein
MKLLMAGRGMFSAYAPKQSVHSSSQTSVIGDLLPSE